MKLSKTRISLAIGAILSTSCLVPDISYGVAFDVLNNKGADNDAGDALLFPFYTTIGSDGNGANTSFSVTNTANATVAVKIRFREQKVSYDALDFIAVLSPQDKFDFTISPGDNGRPKVGWSDSTCVVGPTLADLDAKSVEFPDPVEYNLPPSDTRVVDADLAVGHLEVLGVAALGVNSCVNSAGIPIEAAGQAACTAAGGITTLKAAATHNNSSHQPANCQVVMDFFTHPQNVAMANALSAVGKTAPFFEDAPNSLMGRYLVTIPGRGIEGGEKAVAIQNSNLTTAAGAANVAPTFVTAQSPDSCTDSGNCRTTKTWDQQEYAHPHLGDMAKLSNLQGLLKAPGISGDWSTNPANKVTVNWIVSFPSKYVDLNLVTEFACTGAGSSTAKVWCLNGSKNLCSSSTMQIRGPEEQASSSYTVSPGGSSQMLCNEVNVISFTKAATPEPSLIQTNANRKVVTVKVDATRGWALLPLLGNAASRSVVGLNFTTRDTDNAQNNNGTITELNKTTP